jgi:hypothetical protein
MRKEILKKWWFWVIIVVIVAGISAAVRSTDGNSENLSPTDSATDYSSSPTPNASDDIGDNSDNSSPTDSATDYSSLPTLNASDYIGEEGLVVYKELKAKGYTVDASFENSVLTDINGEAAVVFEGLDIDNTNDRLSVDAFIVGDLVQNGDTVTLSIVLRGAS